MDAPAKSPSQVRGALRLAGRAALTFWLAAVLIGSVAATVSTVLGDVGDWGYAGTLIFSLAAVVFLGGIAGLCHGAAVLVLYPIYSAMDSRHRKASSATTVIAVVLVVFFVLPGLGLRDDLGQTPFLLSL